MRPTSAAWLVVTGLMVLGSASDASAQTKVGGFNLEGDVETGVRFFVDEPSHQRKAKLEEYRDLPNGLLLQDLRLKLFQPDGSYSLEFDGSKWGQQDQEFSFRAGRLGVWQFGFEWDQTPHIYSTNARLLATEISRGVYTLPAARPPLASYNSAPQLDEVGVRWDKTRLFTRLTPTPDLELTAEYTRTYKDGNKPMGMAFGSPGNNFYETLEPIEQTTHDFRLRGALAQERWQLQFGYVLSVFENGLKRLLVDNPCFANAAACGAGDGAGPTRGQTSLPPNNMAHSFNLAGGINLPMRTRVNANLAYSLRLQEQSFLPHTVNQTLAGNPDLALPKPNLDGVVNTWLVNMSATTRPLEPLTLGLKYRYYEYDDHSRTLTFPSVVVNDLSVSPARSAGRWSWERQNADLDARVQIARPVAYTLGVGWERWDRNEHREVPESDEFFGKAALDVTPTDWLLARLTYRPSLRRINQYNSHAHAEHSVVEDASAALAGPSVLLRKFDEAERDRHKLELQLQFTPTEAFTVSHTSGYRYDDFVSSPLGLQQETSWSTGIDFTWAPLEHLSFSGGYTYEQIDQKMRSRSRPVTGTTTFDFVDYDWLSNLADTVHTVHAGAKAALIPKVLDLTLGANYSNALGRIETRNPVAPTSGTTAQDLTASARRFPAFEDTLLHLEAALKYYFLKNWTASLGYAFESFEKTDWRTDQLDPFMPGVTSIWLGNDLKNYTAHLVGATLSYRFK